ncbi:MAG: anthranilate phosphoribosyltransferase [Kiritimatiellaeota bacterium]|nr:anthranilate phosphoribosyltransferase [Kiritimatiellota bacterium]
MFDTTLKKLLDGKSLAFEEAENAMDEIMDGNVSPAKLAGWLVALKLKIETSEEIGGCAASMNRHSTKIRCDDEKVIDIVGTGGDGAKTFNISTAAAFVAAGAGATVAKHGNRSVSSLSGSADVLTELGVRITMSPESMEQVLAEIKIAFLFAPSLHPAMKHAMPVRKELGTRTIFNILGPLCNPALASRMVIGVYSEPLCATIAEAAKAIGKKHVMVVHGSDGLDEITTTSPTLVCELRDGKIKRYHLEPEKQGIQLARAAEIAGGTPADNAKLIRAILTGKERGAPRNIVTLNAAAGILVANLAEDWKGALRLAEKSIDSGAAADKLAKLAAVGDK